jgi:hypothetical protein
MISREIRKKIRPVDIRTNRIVNTWFIVCLALVLSGGLFGCSTAAKHPSGLPLRYDNKQYGFTFFLPATWKGYSVLIQEWNAELRSADYQTAIGRERGPIIVLRHPQWNAGELYQDIPILVFTRRQWDLAIPQRLFVGAGGTEYEISYSTNYVFGINSRHNWGELNGWEETGTIVQQNVVAGMPHLYPDPP